MSGDTFRFDAAINPYGCAPSVVEAMEEFARSRSYRFYGEPFAESLKERLGEHLGVSADSVLVYNGAGEALVWQFIAHLLLPQGRLMAPHPSYERFVAVGARCAAEVTHVPLAEDFALDVDRMVEVGREKGVSVSLLSSPNNPTGNILLDEATLRHLLDSLPNCLWIVDEAYADYPGVTFAPLTSERENLVVLRTFSKAYGLAGLRVGYAVAHPALSARMRELQIPWAVDSMALVAAEAALRDQAYLSETVALIQADCAELAAALNGLPHVTCAPSDANFLLIELDESMVGAVTTRFEEEGISVRRRDDMPNHIRVTSMLPADNHALVEALSVAAPRPGG